MKANPFFNPGREILQLLAFCVLAVVIPVGLLIVGVTRFGLVDENSWLYVALPAVTLCLAVIVQVVWRKVFFRSWSSQPSALWIVIILGLGVCAAFAVLGAFLIVNGTLDSGVRKANVFQVLETADPPHVVVRPVSTPEAAPVRMDIGKAYWKVGPGAVLTVKQGRGFFGQAWVAQRSVSYPDGAQTRPTAPEVAESSRSPARLLGTVAVVAIVLWATRWSAQRRRPA